MDKSTLIMAYEAAKDQTDLELALLYAARNYEEEILVFGGLGGRLDQMFANILLLMHPELRGRNISFKTRYQRIWLIAGEATIEGESGDTVSLIPLGGDVRVAATEGLHAAGCWPLERGGRNGRRPWYRFIAGICYVCTPGRYGNDRSILICDLVTCF